MSVNEKINELRRLNYFVEQDARDFPNPFLLLSDNQALNKLYLEGHAGFKLPAQVVQGRDDTEAVYDIGAANSRRERAQNARESIARANEAIANTKSRINARARNIADLASLQRMGALKSLFVREPGASKHHHATLGRYDFALPDGSGSDSSSDSSKNSVSSGRSVVMSRERDQALDRLPDTTPERQGERSARREKSERRVKYLKRSGKKVSDDKNINDQRADQLNLIAQRRAGSATEGDITDEGERSGAGRDRKAVKKSKKAATVIQSRLRGRDGKRKADKQRLNKGGKR
tara:strand:- start:833 stop:1705 length:873 start_codon:yes stop_codon:yes gene_type:complete